MQIELEQQRFLVTGAGSGIGRAIALALAAAGARVAVNDLHEDAVSTTCEAMLAAGSPTPLPLPSDVSVGTQVTAMQARLQSEWGGVDGLVNNAAIIQVKPFLEVTEADWDRMLATNLKSMFLTCQAVLPGMLAQQRGVIINIASELGYLGRELYAPYTAAKGGVISLTRSLAREFGPQVRVNGIAPGPIDTPMLQSELALTGNDETTIPAGRLGRPEEIAATAVFLASDYASFYYGEILSPNGGALMR